MVHTCTLQVEHSLRSPVPSLKESLQPKKRRAVRQALLPSPALETNEKGGEGTKERDGKEGEGRRKRGEKQRGGKKEGRTYPAHRGAPGFACDYLRSTVAISHERKHQEEGQGHYHQTFESLHETIKVISVPRESSTFFLGSWTITPPAFFFFFCYVLFEGRREFPSLSSS